MCWKTQLSLSCFPYNFFLTILINKTQPMLTYHLFVVDYAFWFLILLPSGTVGFEFPHTSRISLVSQGQLWKTQQSIFTCCHIHNYDRWGKYSMNSLLLLIVNLSALPKWNTLLDCRVVICICISFDHSWV